jgi:hypothetical protein
MSTRFTIEDLLLSPPDRGLRRMRPLKKSIRTLAPCGAVAKYANEVFSKILPSFEKPWSPKPRRGGAGGGQGGFNIINAERRIINPSQPPFSKGAKSKIDLATAPSRERMFF